MQPAWALAKLPIVFYFTSGLHVTCVSGKEAFLIAVCDSFPYLPAPQVVLVGVLNVREMGPSLKVLTPLRLAKNELCNCSGEI